MPLRWCAFERRCAYSDRPPRLISSPRRPPRSTTSVSFAALHPLCAIRRREHHPCAFRECSAGLGGGTGPTDVDRLASRKSLASPSLPRSYLAPAPARPLPEPECRNLPTQRALGLALVVWFFAPVVRSERQWATRRLVPIGSTPFGLRVGVVPRPPVDPTGSRHCHVLRRSSGSCASRSRGGEGGV